MPDQTLHHLLAMPDGLRGLGRRGRIQAASSEERRDALRQLQIRAREIASSRRPRFVADDGEGAAGGKGRLDRFGPPRIGAGKDSLQEGLAGHADRSRALDHEPLELRCGERGQADERRLRDVPIGRAPERVDPALRERRGEGRAHRPGGRAGPASELLLVDAVLARFLDPEHEAVGERAALQLVEHPAPPLLVASGEGRRPGIQNDSAPDRRHRREPAEHEAVPGRGRDRPRESELDARRAPGRNLAGLQNPHGGGGFRSEVVERQPVPAPDARRARQKLDAGDDAAGCRERGRCREHEPAPQIRELGAHEIRAHPLSRTRFVDLAPVHLQAANAHGPPIRQHFEPVVLADAAGDEAPGHDGSEARDEEGAVDGKPRDRLAARGFLVERRAARRQTDEGRLQRLETLAGLRRDGHDRRVLEEGTARELAHVRGGDLDELRRNAIALGHRDHAGRQAEETHDLEMLPGLGHHGFVGGDDHEHRLDAAGAGEHVAHEALVARNVHEGHPDSVPLGMGEPEVDGDPAALLLGKAVGVDPRERLHERGLAVIDVAGRPDEEPFHGRRVTPPCAFAGDSLKTPCRRGSRRS